MLMTGPTTAAATTIATPINKQPPTIAADDKPISENGVNMGLVWMIVLSVVLVLTVGVLVTFFLYKR